MRLGARLAHAAAAARRLAGLRADQINPWMACLVIAFAFGLFLAASGAHTQYWRAGVERDGAAATAKLRRTIKGRYSRIAEIEWHDGAQTRVAQVEVTQTYLEALRAGARDTLPIKHRGDDIVILDDDQSLLQRHPLAPGLLLAGVSLAGLLLLRFRSRRASARKA